MVEKVSHTPFLGEATESLKDPYADGLATLIWYLYMGNKSSFTSVIDNFIKKKLDEYGCKHVLDVACGTGVNSIALLELGFQVTSADVSDQMLKYALKERWNRRKEPAFDQWVIEEANWLTLPQNIHKPGEGYDAVICLGNSFPHLLDYNGDQSDIKLAIRNFYDMIKPGGILVIDHRNFDYILNTGKTPTTNIYYKSKYIDDIKTSTVYVDGEPAVVTLDYTMDVSLIRGMAYLTDTNDTKKGNYFGEIKDRFRLSFYPHQLEPFTKLLDEVFGSSSRHDIYGDFKVISQENPPAFYIHIIEKKA
ncbi:hypothetical protein CHUAL_004339 [Chamberlinius hualienensis]